MKPWSKKADKCTVCNTTERRHMAKGLCVYCYLKQHHNDPVNRAKVLAQKQEHYLTKQKPKAKETRERLYFDGNRQAVLQRDNHTCQTCFRPGNIIHHIDGNGRNSKTPNNTMTNLITLCRACHAAEHREQLISSRFKPGRDGWAKSYKQCVLCHRTDSKHNSKGRCARCMAKIKRETKI
jgi:5-methylcytosine-specific restriction endonuclease McrA